MTMGVRVYESARLHARVCMCVSMCVWVNECDHCTTLKNVCMRAWVYV